MSKIDRNVNDVESGASRRSSSTLDLVFVFAIAYLTGIKVGSTLNGRQPTRSPALYEPIRK